MAQTDIFYEMEFKIVIYYMQKEEIMKEFNKLFIRP